LQEFIKKDKFKEKCSEIDVLIIPFLRWLVASNRAHLKRLPEKNRLKEMNTPWQFLLLTSHPEKEISFQEFKKKIFFSLCISWFCFKKLACKLLETD